MISYLIKKKLQLDEKLIPYSDLIIYQSKKQNDKNYNEPELEIGLEKFNQFINNQNCK